MNYTFLTGLIGSLVLVAGAAWPESKDVKRATKSVRDWLFAIGGFIMLLYAFLGSQQPTTSTLKRSLFQPSL